MLQVASYRSSGASDVKLLQLDLAGGKVTVQNDQVVLVRLGAVVRPPVGASAGDHVVDDRFGPGYFIVHIWWNVEKGKGSLFVCL